MRLVRTLLAALAVAVSVSACGSDITAPSRAAKTGKVEAIKSGSTTTTISEPIEETQMLFGGTVDSSGMIPAGCITTEVIILGIVQTVILCDGRQMGSGG